MTECTIEAQGNGLFQVALYDVPDSDYLERSEIYRSESVGYYTATSLYKQYTRDGLPDDFDPDGWEEATEIDGQEYVR